MSAETCGRCGLHLCASKAIGGGYGVACGSHRYCIRCWFDTDYEYGDRATEAKDVRSMPLVGRDPQENRWGGSPVCFACAFQKPFYVTKGETA